MFFSFLVVAADWHLKYLKSSPLSESTSFAKMSLCNSSCQPNLFPQAWKMGSVQFSHSVVSNCLQPHGLQHARLLCPSPTPRAYSNSNVHLVSDAIQPSHPLLSPFPPAFNLSQHQGLFQWVSSLYQVAKVLEFQFQHQSFQWILKTDFL